MKTHAKRRGKDWVLNGSKMWITNGARGIVTIVFARVGQDDQGGGITAFLVPQDSTGYDGSSLKGKLAAMFPGILEKEVERWNSELELPGRLYTFLATK
jgi:alkylation response protein AidB-like acyl-CoA dehydrogenase